MLTDIICKQPHYVGNYVCMPIEKNCATQTHIISEDIVPLNDVINVNQSQ